jgi:hypothetical protein
MTDTFEQLMRESEKAIPVPESIAKYAAALVAGTHEITSLTIRPKRQWVGLTDDEIIDVIHPLVMADMPDQATDYEIARAIEAKLKEKNT